MGPGLTALLVFIALIIIWAVVLKRNIVEAAILSLIILPFFGGVDQAPGLMTGAIKYVLNYEVLYASLAFIVMSFLLQHSNVLDGMLHIFTRLFGRLKGGPRLRQHRDLLRPGLYVRRQHSQRRHCRCVHL